MFLKIRANWKVCWPNHFSEHEHCVYHKQQAAVGFWTGSDALRNCCEDGRTVLTKHHMLAGWRASGENKGVSPFRARILRIAGAGCTQVGRGVHGKAQHTCIGAFWRCLWGGNSHIDNQGCLHLNDSDRDCICSCWSPWQSSFDPELLLCSLLSMGSEQRRCSTYWLFWLSPSQACSFQFQMALAFSYVDTPICLSSHERVRFWVKGGGKTRILHQLSRSMCTVTKYARHGFDPFL